MMPYSGATTSIYSSNGGKRNNLVLIGDSITWGYGLEANQTIGYLLQQKINSHYNFTPATWGGGNDIVARSITTDDVSTYAAFNGGTTGVARHITGSGYIFNPGYGIYPFSAYTHGEDQIYIGGNIIRSGWNNGGICLLPTGKLSFNVNFPTTNKAYFLVTAMGAGQFSIKVNGVDLSGMTNIIVGGTYTGTVTKGDNRITNVSIIYGNIVTGSYVANYDGSFYPAYEVATTVTDYSNNTITMSAVSPITGTYTFYALRPTPQIYVLGPVGASGSATYSIEQTAGVPVITSLHPTPEFPTEYTSVQIHARNSYGITDFSATDEKIPGLIAGCNTSSVEELISAGKNSRAVYMIFCGIVNMIDTGTVGVVTYDRRITPAQYRDKLSLLALYLSNKVNRNYGRVILVVPAIPTGGSKNNLLSIFPEYREQIIDLAKNFRMSYIDLTQVPMTSSDYQDDGLHPSASGAVKISKFIINKLGL
jgi:lysophospholipase L1-like esterase